MKNPERVAGLLAELRELTETDFERHRIDVLERDLTAPPVVEVVDGEHQRFDGVIYGKNSGGHYATSYPIHRAVWAYCHGDIPEGDYVIHHIDGNKANNALPNLQLLTASEHSNIHNAKFKRASKKCPICGKMFHPRHHYTQYCSEACFRQMQKQQEQRFQKTCPVCGKTFLVVPSLDKQVCCSKSCATKFRYKKYLAPARENQCVVCGKTFSSQRSETKCCSASCAAKLRWQRQKAKPSIN